MLDKMLCFAIFKELYLSFCFVNLMEKWIMWLSRGDKQRMHVSCHSFPLYANIAVQSVQFSHSVMSYSLRPHGLQHTRPPCPSPAPGALTKLMSIKSVMSSNHLILCLPLLVSFSTFSSIRVFSTESVLPIRWPKYWTCSFSISPSHEYSKLILLRIVWFLSPCSPRDSQESSPTAQFKSINFYSLRFLYSTTLTSIHDYWKNHSFAYRGLCWQRNVSAF